MGPRDLENKSVEIARRDNLTKEVRSIEGIDSYIEDLLKTIQQDIYNKAFEFRKNNITKVDTYEEFKKSSGREGRIYLCTLGWNG